MAMPHHCRAGWSLCVPIFVPVRTTSEWSNPFTPLSWAVFLTKCANGLSDPMTSTESGMCIKIVGILLFLSFFNRVCFLSWISGMLGLGCRIISVSTSRLCRGTLRMSVQSFWSISKGLRFHGSWSFLILWVVTLIYPSGLMARNFSSLWNNSRPDAAVLPRKIHPIFHSISSLRESPFGRLRVFQSRFHSQSHFPLVSRAAVRVSGCKKHYISFTYLTKSHEPPWFSIVFTVKFPWSPSPGPEVLAYDTLPEALAASSALGGAAGPHRGAAVGLSWWGDDLRDLGTCRIPYDPYMTSWNYGL